MPRKKKIVTDQESVTPTTSSPETVKVADLANAFAQALQSVKPVEKKTAANRVPRTPYNTDKVTGQIVTKLKLKRKMHQHGIPLDPDMLTNDQIDLFNKLKPGRFLDNWVLVTRRKDRGMDITYPVKTAAQRMKLSSQFGIAGPKALEILLQRCIDEAANPKPDAHFDNEDE